MMNFERLIENMQREVVALKTVRQRSAAGVARTVKTVPITMTVFNVSTSVAPYYAAIALLRLRNLSEVPMLAEVSAAITSVKQLFGRDDIDLLIYDLATPIDNQLDLVIEFYADFGFDASVAEGDTYKFNATIMATSDFEVEVIK